MGFRFRKKITIVPGLLAINLNKSIFTNFGKDVSLTVGGRGLGMNVSRHGIEGYTGIPDSGMIYRSKVVVRPKPTPVNSPAYKSIPRKKLNPIFIIAFVALAFYIVS